MIILEMPVYLVPPVFLHLHKHAVHIAYPVVNR